MFKLIALELRKNRFKVYSIASIFVFLFGFALCFMAVFTPEIAKDRGLPLPIDMSMFVEWKTFILIVSTVIFSSFAIMSAVMHSLITIEEYLGKRAVLLFSYPVKRSRILFAKCLLVFGFTIFATSISNILAILLFGLISNGFNIMPEQFTIDTFIMLLKTTAIVSPLSAAVGLVSLRIGFWRKSMVATIVSSFILIVPFGNLSSFFPESSFEILLTGMAVLLLIGFFVFALLLRKVNRMEVI